MESVSPSARLQQIRPSGGSPSDTPQYAALPGVRKVAIPTDAVARLAATKAQRRTTALFKIRVDLITQSEPASLN
jgi:hypothetical protein